METYFEVHSEFNKQTILDMSRHVIGKKMWLIKVLCAIAAGLFLLAYCMTFIVFQLGTLLQIGTKILG